VAPGPRDRGRRAGQRVWRPERRVLLEHRALDPAQRGSGLDAELLDEALAGIAISGERIGLAAGAVQRQHLLATEPLAQRVLRDEAVELADHVGVAPARQVGLDALLERRQPRLLEPVRVDCERGVVREVAERRPAPQLQRRSQRLGRTRAVAGAERGATLAHQHVELLGVELVIADHERVPPPARDQPAFAERLAQPGHEVVHAAPRARGRRVFPERVDEAIARQRLVRVQQEHGEQDALPTLGQRHRPWSVLYLEGTEDPIAHEGSGPTLPAWT
jgi:hypothetical protein